MSRGLFRRHCVASATTLELSLRERFAPASFHAVVSPRGLGERGPSSTLRLWLCAAKILTVSDSVHAGLKEDESGVLIAQHLERAGFSIVDRRVVPDGVESVASALRAFTQDFSGLVVTTGGTGFSPRDLTPEASLLVFEREAPGLAEAMRLANPPGRLSRPRAGVVGRGLILNTPGSSAGAIEYLEAVGDILGHVLALLEGQASQQPPDTGGRTATSS